LTEKGREKLAKGQLNFSYWGIGDSEINYDREEIVDNNQDVAALSGASNVLRPFDRQPDIKSFITTAGGDHLTTMNSANINVIKAIVNNRATDRGFFSGITSTQYDTLTSTTYVKSYGSVSNTAITGGTNIVISSAITRSVGDFLLLRLARNNSPIISSTVTNNLTPLPYLWYKIVASNATSVTLDRTLPNYSNQSTSSSEVFIYKSGEVATAFGSGTTTAYWDSGTLSFDSASNVSCCSVPVWNMNNVYCENLAGMTGMSTTKLYEDYTKFGSYTYLGTKNPYLEYLCEDSTASTTTITCDTNGQSYADDVSKSISILHYTNNTISNFYGEFLYIDNTVSKTVVVSIPDMMYHRRGYSTESGSTMGMKFVASGDTSFVGDSDIEYVELVEDSSLIGSKTPLVVGRVYPQLKMIVIHDDEIVAALSYKSNRNWTLPPLSATLSAPSGGTSTGVLQPTETMYLTYSLENASASGLSTTLPCQSYIKINNSTSSAKDVSFKISGVDLLPYMHKVEKAFYDGTGFCAYQFKLVYQVVADSSTRPDANAWKVYDYTSTAITTTASQSIDPLKLENQTPTTNGFVLTSIVNSAATQFDITQSLSMSPNTISGADTLQFGDERFFYGNIETYIGATIYKTLFDIRVNSGQYNTTSNPTRSKDASTNPPNIKITEVGIYDSDKNLVVIGKLSTPIALLAGDTIMIELSMDF
jgi:hypothetical protein